MNRHLKYQMVMEYRYILLFIFLFFAILKEFFLQEESRILSVNTIGEKLWDVDGNYENRVYQVINRLRGFLKQFPSLTIDKVLVGSYQLKISEI